MTFHHPEQKVLRPVKMQLLGGCLHKNIGHGLNGLIFSNGNIMATSCIMGYGYRPSNEKFASCVSKIFFFNRIIGLLKELKWKQIEFQNKDDFHSYWKFCLLLVKKVKNSLPSWPYSLV